MENFEEQIEKSDVEVIVKLNSALGSFSDLSPSGKEKYLQMQTSQQTQHAIDVLKSWINLLESKK
jgi:hypothetical protein